MALQSGTSAEARNSVQLAQCVLESYENLSVELQVKHATSNDLLCLIFLQESMHYYLQFVDCESDPECSDTTLAYYLFKWAEADFKFMECINVI
jgi:hypothetical protein